MHVTSWFIFRVFRGSWIGIKVGDEYNLPDTARLVTFISPEIWIQINVSEANITVLSRDTSNKLVSAHLNKWLYIYLSSEWNWSWLPYKVTTGLLAAAITGKHRADSNCGHKAFIYRDFSCMYTRFLVIINAQRCTDTQENRLMWHILFQFMAIKAFPSGPTFQLRNVVSQNVFNCT